MALKRYTLGEQILGEQPGGGWGVIGWVGETGAILAEYMGKYQAEQLRKWERGRYAPIPEPITFSPEDALREAGFKMPEGWQLKLTPIAGDGDFTQALISPAGEELAFEDVFVGPEGEWLSRAEIERLEVKPIEEYESIWAEFGGYPAAYQAPIDYERIQKLIEILLPERVTGMLADDLEVLRMYVEEDTEAFWEGIQRLGWTEDTEALLRAIPFERPITEADLQEIFGVEKPLKGAITEEGDFIEQGFFESLWDAVQVGARQFLHRTAQYFVSTLPNKIFVDIKPGQAITVAGRREPLYLTPEETARMNQRNKQQRDKFRQIYAENQALNEEWIAKHPEFQPPPRYKEDITKNLGLLKEPGYWGYVIGEAVTFSLAVLGTTLGVTFATKNPYLGLAAGTAMATPSQSQDLYEDLLTSGAPEDKAAEIAIPIGMVIASIEAVTNLPLLKAISPAFNLLKRNIQQAVVKQTMMGLFTKGVKTFTIIEIVEALEEVTQGAIHNAFVRAYDEDRQIFERVDETIIKTLIATSPFAIFGGGMSLRHISPEVAETVPPEQKKSEGWEQDTLTGEWYKPDRLTEIYEEHFNNLVKEGLTEEQARLKALNEVARTPEGEKAISQAAEKIKEGVPVKPEIAVPEVKPPAVEEVTIPRAEVGMPEVGVQPSMIEAVPAKEVRPFPKAEIVQARMDDYLKLKKYEEAQVTNRIDEIKRLLAIKGRLPAGKGTKVELSLELARLEAQQDVAGFTSLEEINIAIGEVENELGLRGMPYHGGVKKTLFPDKTSKQLDEMLKVYREARNQLLPKEAVEPVPALPEPTAEELATNLATLGSPTLTPAQVTRTLDLFGKYITDPSALSAWELTRELRRETLAVKAENLKGRAQELIVEKGIPVEEAMNQAIRETLSGELPVARTDYLDDLTSQMREALFNKVYQTLKNEPLEMTSTVTALTNALLGRAIPREPGIRGGSAYTRLQRVFGEQPQVFEAIKIGAREGKTLEDVVEGIYHEIGRPPIPVDQKTADYLRTIGKKVKTIEDVAAIEAYREARPPPPYEPPIQKALSQVPMWPRPARDMLIKVLKEIGWSPIDIGNFLRANKASADFSFWRQQGPLILNHPVSFVIANIKSWNATWSQKAAEASYERITRSPLYQIYEAYVNRTGKGDFLRPLELVKGTEQYRGVEEFGFPTFERLIPRLTMKIPYIKFSARGFVTGTNEHNWRIYENHYDDMLELNEMYASGEKKLKPMESFSIENEMGAFQEMLTDFTQRASLGKVKGLAPVINSMFFAPRATLGRFLTPRHLLSANPRVRKEAWRNLTTFVAGVGGIVLLGVQLGLWEVEKDPRSAEFMSIRIGNIRIDPWVGYRQFLVFYTRVITGTGLSSVTGAEYEIDPIRAMTTFVRGKAAPLLSIILDFWTGRNFIGEEVDVANKKQWLERILPFSLQDIFEAYMLEPGKAPWIILPAIVGYGVQTYTGDWVENWPKMGLPKYTENLTYGLTEPVYDVKDFWADTSGQFKGVDPATLTKEKGYPPYIRAIVEARVIKEYLDTLPNQKLTSINADPSKDDGLTFDVYYRQWRDREKLVIEGDEEKLKEFDADERTRNAHLGNFSQRQFSLLVEYHLITDKVKQADFLEDHPELEVNPRLDWLITHPKDNAQLAIWGQAKVLTQEAYDEAQRMIRELDIPDNAVEEYLPPKDIVAPYFELNEASDKWGSNSWEAKLILAKNPELTEWLEREIPDTPIASLELKVKHRDLFDQFDAYSDKDSPFYIEDDDRRDEARDKLKADNPEWVDDMRRIEAIENEASDTIVEAWVERGRLVDEFSGGSSEAKVWLIDHPEAHKWALEQGLLTDDGSDWNERVLRINVEMRDLDEGSEEYRRLNYKKDAYQIDFPEVLVDTYIEWYMTPRKDYEDDWFLMENREFYLKMVELGKFQRADFRKVPSRKVFSLYEKYLSLPTTGKVRLVFRHEHPDLEDWLVRAKDYTPVGDRWMEKPAEEKEAKERRKTWVEQMEEQGLLEEWMEKYR